MASQTATTTEEEPTTVDTETSRQLALIADLEQLDGSERVRIPEHNQRKVMLGFWNCDVPREFFEVLTRHDYRVHNHFESDYDVVLTLYPNE